ncbi:MAG: TPM domain-containing protein [Verrucomicrobiota bacterium]
MAKDVFGYDDVHFHQLSDLADCLEKKERQQLQKLIDRLEKRFPQLWFGICFVALSERASLREFGFWLMNHATVTSDEPRPNENGVILTIDLTSRVAGFSLGYYSERFMSDGDLFRALNEGAPYLKQGDYELGVRVMLERFAKILAQQAREAARYPERFRRTQPVEPDESLSLEPIREEAVEPAQQLPETRETEVSA